MSFGLFSDLDAPSAAEVFSTEPKVSVVIPTFREEGYIVNTLNELRKQTLWNEMEVVISDFDPEQQRLTVNAIKSAFPDEPRIKIVDVDKPGIGYARAVGTNAAKGKFIVTFDADARFQRLDAIERLIAPIQAGQADSTHTGNVMDVTEKQTGFSAMLYHGRNDLMRILPLAYEPGFTFTKRAYELAGGWKDVKALEGPMLALDMMLKGLRLVFVDEALVIVSARRVGNVLDLDYNNAYRNGQVIKTGREGGLLGFV